VIWSSIGGVVDVAVAAVAGWQCGSGSVAVWLLAVAVWLLTV
jgi:hypothetical protein